MYKFYNIDGKYYAANTEDDTSLKHWKYIEKTRVNGKWVYTYPSGTGTIENLDLKTGKRTIISRYPNRYATDYDNVKKEVESAGGELYRLPENVEEGKQYTDEIVNEMAERRNTFRVETMKLGMKFVKWIFTAKPWNLIK